MVNSDKDFCSGICTRTGINNWLKIRDHPMFHQRITKNLMSMTHFISQNSLSNDASIILYHC